MPFSLITKTFLYFFDGESMPGISGFAAERSKDSTLLAPRPNTSRFAGLFREKRRASSGVCRCFAPGEVLVAPGPVTLTLSCTTVEPPAISLAVDMPGAPGTGCVLSWNTLGEDGAGLPLDGGLGVAGAAGVDGAAPIPDV